MYFSIIEKQMDWQIYWGTLPYEVKNLTITPILLKTQSFSSKKGLPNGKSFLLARAQRGERDLFLYTLHHSFIDKLV